MDKPFYIFTTQSNGLRSHLTNEVVILSSNPIAPIGNPVIAKALWDTGATGSVITPELANQAGLQVVDKTIVDTANGARESLVYKVAIILPNNVLVENVRVTEASLVGASVLIGMDIISRGDFAVSNFQGKTFFTFRMPSKENIDFLQQ